MKWIKTHQPCPCGKSSDAYAIALDGHGFCFSCGKVYGAKNLAEEADTGFTFEYLDRRNITKETHEFFGVRTQIDAAGKPVSVAYPYPNGAKQIRFLEPVTKADKFRSAGDMSGASGWPLDKFPAASAKAITITEGNDDAMSVWQMLGKYPVYAIRSATSALHDVRADYDYLNSFEKIYLALDSDEPGKRAAKEIAAVFGYGKIYFLDLAPLKDATEYNEKGRQKEFRNLWFNATRYMPETVISSFAAIEKEFSRRTDVVRYEWPWISWQQMTGGIEIHRQYLISGLEGTGKTEELHEIAAHLLDKYPDMNIGFIHAEEPVVDTVTIQVGKHLRKPIHLDGYRMPDKEVLELYKKRVGREDRVHFFRHFGSEETDVLLSTIRFMVAACGCKVVLLDNYQHLVTGRTKDRDVEALDYLANRLEALVKELDFALIAISHENDNEQARGSRNITKEADVWINIKRDVTNANEHLRNIQYVTFNKNRQGQKTGPGGRLIYDVSTATLSELTEELPT